MEEKLLLLQPYFKVWLSAMLNSAAFNFKSKGRNDRNERCKEPGAIQNALSTNIQTDEKQTKNKTSKKTFNAQG